MQHQRDGRSRLGRASGCENAPAVKEQTDSGSARLDQIFYPKILQSPEGFQLHPHGNEALVLRQVGTITVSSSPLSLQHQGVPEGTTVAGSSCWEEDWR